MHLGIHDYVDHSHMYKYRVGPLMLAPVEPIIQVKTFSICIEHVCSFFLSLIT